LKTLSIKSRKNSRQSKRFSRKSKKNNTSILNWLLHITIRQEIFSKLEISQELSKNMMKPSEEILWNPSTTIIRQPAS